MGTHKGSAPFAWVPDVERGAWIAERLDGGWDEALERRDPALGDIVPSGFDALIRVLHPFPRDRPATGSWADYDRVVAGFEASGEWGEAPEFRHDSVTWREAADDHGVELRPDSLAFELLGLEKYGEGPSGTERSPDGWSYGLPLEGDLDDESLAAVARVLAAHTSTPAHGIAGIWEGYSGLVSAPDRAAYFGWTGEPRAPRSAWANWLSGWVRTRAIETQLRRTPPEGSGALSKEAATGPRLELPDRRYFCFEAGIDAFFDDGWMERAPWVDTEAEFGNREAPNLIWPEAQEWILVSEIDFDSTLIACSRACADALLAEPGAETVEISRDTPLWQLAD